MRDIRSDRSIRNIPVPASHRRHAEEHEYEEEDTPRTRRRSRGGKWFWLAALLVVVVAGAGALLLSTVFAGATVTVLPRTEAVTPPQRMNAVLNAPPGTLAYQSISVTRTATTTLKATGTSHVERQATGRVVIFNTYSSASQRLIANTRFQAPDGKIYRIKESVDVPGQGTAEAQLYADSAGADFNRSEPTRFTIPGFKGDPRYEKFYAESQGAISGGFVGEEASVQEADFKEARTAMERALDASVREAIGTGVPEGYFLVPNSLALSFSDILKSPASGNSVSVSQSVVAQGQMIRLQDLASYIARQASTGYKGEAVDFADPAQITVALASSTKAGNSIELALSGSPTLVWQFDPNAIKSALLGKPKGEFETIVKSFEPAISRAEARIRPFWQSRFPGDADKINVKVGNR